jgi:hypothetical protein
MTYRVTQLSDLAILVVLGAMMYATPPAHAASFDYLETAGQSVSVNPGHFLIDAQGTWVTGNSTARFASNGSLSFAEPTELPGGDALLAVTSDGSLLRATFPVPGTPQVVPCEVSKLTPTRAVAWDDPIPTGDRCVWMAVSSDDTIWVETASYRGGFYLYRVLSDGSEMSQILFPADFLLASPPVLTADNGIVVAGTNADQDASYVVAVTTDGSIAWTEQGSSDGLILTGLGADASGNLYAAGTTNGGKLGLVSLTAAGASRWSKQYDAPGLDLLGGFVVTASGASYALERPVNNTFPALEKIDAAGNLLWTQQLPLQGFGSSPLSLIDNHAGLRIAPNGDVLALADTGNFLSSSTTTELVRYNDNGNVISTAVLTGAPDANVVGVADMAALSDSTALLTVYSSFNAADGSGLVGSPAVNGMAVHLDRNGQALASPFAGSVARNGVVLDSSLSADGTAYLMTLYETGAYNDVANNIVGGITARYTVSKVAPDGTRVWQQGDAGYWYNAQVSAGVDRVCIGGSFGSYGLVSLTSGTNPNPPALRVECHAITSGAALFSTVIAPTSTDTPFGLPVAVRALADGRTIAAYHSDSIGVQIFVLDAAGNVQQSHVAAGVGGVAGIAADGSVLCINGHDYDVAVVGDDGSVLYHDVAVAGTNVLLAHFPDDLSAQAQYVSRNSDGSLQLAQVSSSGSGVWSVMLLDASAAADFAQAASADDSSNTYVAIVAAARAKIFKVDRSSGAIHWQTALSPVGTALGIGVDPVSANPLVYTLFAHKLGFTLLDAGSGSAGLPSYQTCGNVDCVDVTLGSGRIGLDGTLRLVLPSSIPFVPDNAPQVLGVANIAQVPAPIPVAQNGIDGAWYAPYASGQGFTIDFIAANNTIFMPWFTYVPTGGNDPAAVVWFTLQGNPAPNATSVDLLIGSTDGGVFESGTVGTQQVGTAQLSFSDCDHGTLSYQFDESVNAGATGIISITRLGPATSSCVAADGTVRPAEDASPPLDGFDAHQSGSWYDPDTSGQGLEFTVIPAGNGFSGLLFATWYTFDPAGASDDPANQHWFTLQGDLSSAANGQATVGIAATLGGSFDDMPTGNIARIGQATVTFTSCTDVTVDYQFDDVATAHAYRNLAGTMHLVKIGGCTP